MVQGERQSEGIPDGRVNKCEGTSVKTWLIQSTIKDLSVREVQVARAEWLKKETRGITVLRKAGQQVSTCFRP